MTPAVGQGMNDSATGSASRGAAREQAILNAAIELVAEIGYDRMTTDAIVKRARASKATLYGKWPGKAELVAEALRRHAGAGTACIPDAGSLRGDLLMAVDAINRTIVGTDAPSLLGLIAAAREGDALRELIRVQIEQQSMETGSVIAERARARGETLSTAQPHLVLELIVAHQFLAVLLRGKSPDAAECEAFIDTTALPLLTGVPVLSAPTV
jgi:AcrR family transcriptional regulator